MRPRRLFFAISALLLLAAPGCSRAPARHAPPDAGAKAETAADAGATPAEDAGAEPAQAEGAEVYTWYDEAGRPHLAARIADVPEAARSHVVVSHLGASAGSALADDVTVADFSGDAPSYSKVDLASLAAGASSGGAALLHHDRVYVYGTPWCGFCKKAKAYLDARGVPYVDRDIEASPQAAAELKAKLKAAGIEFGGVPVLDVRGHVIVGFDRKAIDEVLDDAAARKDAASPKHG